MSHEHKHKRHATDHGAKKTSTGRAASDVFLEQQMDEKHEQTKSTKDDKQDTTTTSR